MKDRFLALGLFLVLFGLYVHSAAPHLAPYRDAGEMVTVIQTLGVAHPPGYPLYTLMGRLSSFFYFGNAAFQLNLFSGACAALALVVLFLTLKIWASRGAALTASLVVGLSHPFYELACVSEMYSLGVLWLCLILYCFFVVKNEALLFFLLGLGLGVRMDFLLLIPLFLFWHWQMKRPMSALPTLIAFLLGGSLYLYLTIRSSVNPLIDWGNPETLLSTFNSATRKSYSGTLDLLSLSYKKGENFFANMNYYAHQLLSSLGWGAVGLVLVGLWSRVKTKNKEALVVLSLFLIMGPFFLFLANMPPNPHSLAIVEASYLFPNLFLVFFLAWGLEFVFRTRWAKVFMFLVLFSLPWNFIHGFQRASKRNNFYVRDFIENVWKSVPANGVAVFHDDVQLFSLWMSQLVERRRPDVSLIASGLSASPWYWEMKLRWPMKQGVSHSLKEGVGWRELLAESPPSSVTVGYDVDFESFTGLMLAPHGFLVSLSPTKEPHQNLFSPFILRNMGLYRGRALYGETADFFSSDLIGDQARAHHQQGFQFMLANDPRAVWFFERAGHLDSTFVRPWSDLGYYYFQKADWLLAEQSYSKALRGFEQTLKLAHEYKSLPDVTSGIRQEYSVTLTQMGVVQERAGRVEVSRSYYMASLDMAPTAQANFNLAVTYWGKDWAQVVRYLEATLRLNPDFAGARGYLLQAKQHLGASLAS